MLDWTQLGLFWVVAKIKLLDSWLNFLPELFRFYQCCCRVPSLGNYKRVTNFRYMVLVETQFTGSQTNGLGISMIYSLPDHTEERTLVWDLMLSLMRNYFSWKFTVSMILSTVLHINLTNQNQYSITHRHLQTIQSSVKPWLSLQRSHCRKKNIC